MKTRQFLRICFLLVIVYVPSAMAQSDVEQAIKDARDLSNDVKQRSIELERMKREAYKRPNSSGISTAKFPEIKEDFEEMQKINDCLYETTAAATNVSDENLDELSEFAARLNRRATRLKSNLFATESNVQKAADDRLSASTGTADIAVLISRLDRLVTSFVHSPLFKNINLVNAEDSLKAENNLEAIVKLSFQIKKRAKDLKKQLAGKR